MPPEFDQPKAEFVCNNELSKERQKEIVAQLLQERSPKTKGQFAYYEVAPNSEMANVARTIEASVFYEYFKEKSATVKELYTPYDAQSIFFLAVDVKTGMPSGALRAIRNGENGLLSLNDLASPPSDEKGVGNISIDAVKEQHGIEVLDECWDIGAIAALPPYRGDFRTSVMLYRAMYKKATQQHIEHIVSIIDTHPYKGSMLRLGIPFQPLAGVEEPFRYYGSKLSHAAYGHVPDFFPVMDKFRKTGKGIMTNLAARGALTRLITGNRDQEIDLLAA